MKDIIISVITLAIITTIARMVLPRIELLVKFIINRLVSFAEKRIKGSKMGDVKKQKVLKWVKLFGINADKFTEELIDSAVEAMNSKGCNIKSDIQYGTADLAEQKIKENVGKIVNPDENKGEN